jgi:hypothetical protein
MATSDTPPPGSDATTTDTEPETAPDDATSPEQLAADVAKWKELARKHEKRAKESHTQLEAIKAAGMTDTEKALAEAHAAGRAEALRESSTALARATLATELATVPGGKLLAESIDPTPFLTEGGAVDADAVSTWAVNYRAQLGTGGTSPPAFDLGQGSRGGAGTQTTANPLADMLAQAVGAPRR